MVNRPLAGTRIVESKEAGRQLGRVTTEVLRAYEIWARVIEVHGLAILREFKVYHDEKLRGKWAGYRSSRLNRKWRVIYSVGRDGPIEVVTVERITPHEYRRR